MAEVTVGPFSFDFDEQSGFISIAAGDNVIGVGECDSSTWESFVDSAQGKDLPTVGPDECVVVMKKAEARAVRVASMLGEPPPPKEGEEDKMPAFQALKDGQTKLGQAESS
jgi:hypothetical protein